MRAPSKDNGGVHQCTLCPASFEDRSQFNVHIKGHLKAKLLANQTTSTTSTTTTTTPPSKRRRCMATSSIMEELAACKLLPPETCGLMPANSASNVRSEVMNPLLEQQQGEMSDEMEANRIELHNDLSSLLDELEKDMASPGGLRDLVSLDTPPDSDSEQTLNINSSNNESNNAALLNTLLPLNEALKELDLPESPASWSSSNNALTASTASMLPPSYEAAVSSLAATRASAPPPYSDEMVISTGNVGPLSSSTLALLSQLPSNLFTRNNGKRTLNVVKVEQPLRHVQQNSETLIRVVCPQAGSKESRLLSVYRAITDAQGGLRLVQQNNGDLANSCNINNAFSNNSNSATTSALKMALEANSLGSSQVTSSFNDSIPTITSTMTNTIMTSHNECSSSKSSFVSTNSSGSCANRSKSKIRNSRASSTSYSSPSEPFPCRLCPQSFCSRAQLRQHEAMMHASELVCDICKKMCKSKLGLSRHRALHLVCPYCPSLFSDMNQVMKHVGSEHGLEATELEPLTLFQKEKRLRNQDTKSNEKKSQNSNSLSSLLTDLNTSEGVSNEDFKEEYSLNECLDLCHEWALNTGQNSTPIST